MRKALVFLCALLFLCAPSALATPGGTDGNGGHYDSKTGEYHFHHGYPAHQHINGECPYDPNFKSSVITADDGTWPPKGNSGGDADDVALPGSKQKTNAPFQGIPRRSQTGLIASGAALALISLGGLLSIAKRPPKD